MYFVPMFAQVHNPDRLDAQQLDDYLSQGWFRMGQTIFTTNFIRFNQEIHSTIWLRHVLDKYDGDATQKKLFKRNAIFRTSFRLAEVTPEKEMLYAEYKKGISFPASESLAQLLFGQQKETENTSIYTTYEVTVHEGDRLVACGYFDLGALAAEGISSFYHPDYKKFSLGKYLIYLKIQFCKELGLRYFYPGYVVPGNHHFDYKLTIATHTLEFLELASSSWRPFIDYSAEKIPYDVMRRKLEEVQSVLAAGNRQYKLFKYNFFDANFVPDMRDTGLLDYPVFLSRGSSDELINPIVIFDVNDQKYRLIICTPAWKPYNVNPDMEFYSDYFIMPVEEICSGDLSLMVEKLTILPPQNPDV